MRKLHQRDSSVHRNSPRLCHTKRIDAAEVVDPETPRAGQAVTRAFFGATVRYATAAGTERVVIIVGTDEVDLNRQTAGPILRLLLRAL